MKRRLLIVTLALLVFASGAMAQDLFKLMGLGDMPMFGQSVKLYVSAHYQAAHWLAQVFGCSSDEQLKEGQTVQCLESFLYFKPGSWTFRAYDLLGNIQSAGYVKEARTTFSS